LTFIASGFGKRSPHFGQNIATSGHLCPHLKQYKNITLLYRAKQTINPIEDAKDESIHH
jgi:hypothetical protein